MPENTTCWYCGQPVIYPIKHCGGYICVWCYEDIGGNGYQYPGMPAPKADEQSQLDLSDPGCAAYTSLPPFERSALMLTLPRL